ncbi:ATP-binding protein [Alteromonas halophila]|uniref:histidine kinase n=1 Tax=Alteromonas halophila TaxID=516698 RepID=A0A918JQ79_9ALTE|nr:ATP-binding protein [Alteromonas halophila]GGW93075.1 hypothetical protein GCM10007391_29190 [Alteromonas halophila]
MLSSIRTQLVLVLSALVILLLLQGVIARQNQTVLIDGLQSTGQAVVDVARVKELEREILDLQRNVLIYKENASESAVRRFERLMLQIDDKLTRLEQTNITQNTPLADKETLTRMRGHLESYQNNFRDVVKARATRDELVDRGSLTDIIAFKQYIADVSEGSAMPPATVASLKHDALIAENAVFKYLISPERALLTTFTQAMDRTRETVQAFPPVAAELMPLLSEAENHFLKLTQITQGNLFLVNVVMAGSANEFLYLSDQLTEQVTARMERIKQQTQERAESTRRNGELFSFIAIVLACLTALFTAYRILGPIRSITDIFIRLSDDEESGEIPGSNRRDEIGKLARAAHVFQNKNRQTEELLQDATEMNSQLERLNQELVDSKRRAEQATASKSIFLANMSHEIRTPLNGIVGLIELAQQQDMSETMRQYLEKAAYSSQILMTVINDILDFSKIEAGKLNIEEVSFSLHSLFDNLLTVIALRAREKNLNVTLTVAPSLPSQVIGDPLRIAQILMNIGANAVKFTDHGGVDIRFDGSLNDKGNQVSLIMTIEDSGIGMSEGQLNRIFQPFTQADGSTNRKYGGTGLGLAIVKQLTELMNGKLDVESAPGRGSRFAVTLPLRVFQHQSGIISALPALPVDTQYVTDTPLLPDAYQEVARLEECLTPKSILEKDFSPPECLLVDIEHLQAFRDRLPQLQTYRDQGCAVGLILQTFGGSNSDKYTSQWTGPMIMHPFTPLQFERFITELASKEQHSVTITSSERTEPALDGHVLLVEDNSINQVVAGEMLNSLGLTFDIAENGRQAISRIENSPHYDAVLMDVQMPVMDGLEATTILRESGYSTLPIIGLSANAMKEDTIQSETAGMNDYLTKPVKRAALRDALKPFLSQHSETNEEQ